VKNQNQPLTLFDIPVIILCGGKSSRMGEDKTYLPFGKTDTLIEFQYKRLSSLFKHVYISSKKNHFDFLTSQQRQCVLLDDTLTAYSPIIALKSILKQVTTPNVFIITVDTPFISEKTIKTLINKADNYEITVACSTEKDYHLCGVFSSSLLLRIEDMLNNDIHKIGYLIKKSHTQIIQFEHEKEFLNMNTKSDYLEALTILKKSPNSSENIYKLSL